MNSIGKMKLARTTMVVAALAAATVFCAPSVQASRFHVRRHVRHGLHKMRVKMHHGHQHLHNLVHHGHM